MSLGPDSTVKQYLLTPLEDGHMSIGRYENGKFIRGTMLEDVHVAGYCEALEDMGYTRGYDVAAAEEEVRIQQRVLQRAEECLAIARQHPLQKKRGK